MRWLIALSVASFGACAHPAPAGWDVPHGWKQEVIPFPLEFAPSLAHHGREELRFPPGFLDDRSPNHWAYTFVWRLDDAADLSAAALADELAAYFRGLLAAVDGDKHRFDPAQITVAVDAAGLVHAHIFDAFGAGGPVDLAGTAHRTACGTGALWTFVLAPDGAALRHELDVLAARAHC